MSRTFSDLIVAPITGLQRAAVTVIRLSGPNAFACAQAVFPALPASAQPRHAYYGHAVTGDDGLALWFPEGHSYTGEDSVELSVHASPAGVQALLAACHAAGARPAGPGEFTQRAFLNGRLDLTQAEAVRATIEAETEAQLRAANANRDGALRAAIIAAREPLFHALAAVEASTDFSEEVGELDRSATHALVQQAQSRIAALIAQAQTGRILAEGLRIALVGRPNAGKSTLLNRLLGADRAIVTPIAGTTRDTLEERCQIGGLPCLLIDTAGLRDTDDPVERIGVERSRHALEHADAVLYLLDNTLGWTPEDQELIALIPEKPILVLGNKADLAPATPDRAVPISAQTGAGLSAITEWVLALAEIPDISAIAATVNPRQATALRAAQEALLEVEGVLTTDRPTDLAAVGLQSAIRSLGEITGETAAPDLLDQIFSRFCIGK